MFSLSTLQRVDLALKASFGPAKPQASLRLQSFGYGPDFADELVSYLLRAHYIYAVF